MSISSKINVDAEPEEQSRVEQTVESTSEAVVADNGGSSAAPRQDSLNSTAPGNAPSAATAETSNQADQAADFEEFTLDDIEVIESKVFA